MDPPATTPLLNEDEEVAAGQLSDMLIASTLVDMRTSVPVPRLIQFLRYYKSRCAHIGCLLPFNPRIGVGYCCADHEGLALAAAKSRVAFQYQGSFKHKNERDRVACELLYNRNRGFEVGVPTLEEKDVGDVFSKAPWDQPEVFPGDLTYTDLLFFMKPPKKYNKSMESIKMSWHQGKRFALTIHGLEDEPTVYFTPFRLDLDIQLRKDRPDLHEKAKLWTLYLFESGPFSLYCLSCSSTIVQGLFEPPVTKVQSNKREGLTPSTSASLALTPSASTASVPSTSTGPSPGPTSSSSHRKKDFFTPSTSASLALTPSASTASLALALAPSTSTGPSPGTPSSSSPRKKDFFTPSTSASLALTPSASTASFALALAPSTSTGPSPGPPSLSSPRKKAFFPFDSHHGFVVQYGKDVDADLGFHVDDDSAMIIATTV